MLTNIHRTRDTSLLPIVKQEFQSSSLDVEQQTMLLKLTLFLSFLSLMFRLQTESIKVVKTADRIPAGLEVRARVEIAGVDLSDHTDLTVCARVKTSQFGSSVHNYQGILSAKPLRILGSYSTIIRKPSI